MCELCKRGAKTTRHHLVPRSRKRREKEGFGPVAELCMDCHRKCHATWDNATLAKEYNTITKIASASELQSYIKWIRKQSPTAYFGSKERVIDD